MVVMWSECDTVLCVCPCVIVVFVADQEFAKGYRVQVVNDARIQKDTPSECVTRFGRHPKIITDVPFDNKVS